MRTINLLFVGDLYYSPDEKFNASLLQPISEEFKHHIVIGNLEGPILYKESPFLRKMSRKYTIHSQHNFMTIIEKYFDVVCLANNHIFDYGLYGFLQTANLLKKAGVLFFGAGKNRNEARRPLIININNVKIGFLGYCWGLTGCIPAKRKKFGVAPLKKKLIFDDIKTLTNEVDTIIVYVHSGFEKERYPLPSQRKLAHEMIDMGAGLIIGSHPHVIQGIEVYNEKLIAYSLGNFIMTDITNSYIIKQTEENKRTLIFKVKIEQDGKIHGHELVPIYFDTNNLIINYGEKTTKHVEEISRPLNLDRVEYKKFWRAQRIRKDRLDTNNMFLDILYKNAYRCMKKLLRLG